MRVLGIDTSTKTGSVALIQGESLSGRGSSSGNRVVLAEYTHGVTQGHGSILDEGGFGTRPYMQRNDSDSWLLSAVDCVLHEGDIWVNENNDRIEIDGIAVVIGPGTFTGLRIGVSTAKGLGYALGVQIAEVISLDALAANIPSGIVCPIMDAMRGEVYAAFYEHGKRRSKYMLIKPEDLVQKILEKSDSRHQVTLLGDGVMLWGEFFAKRLPEIVSFAPSHNSYIKAINVAGIGMDMLIDGRGKKPEEIIPFYLRASSAETSATESTEMVIGNQ
ncbi:tRNA (adenosine(37)-N6)-threonylcarbamoyltransferase complex dimerization subunit type 1 TsaB [Candidatus Desantisbacteria bacterium]|nr:tRNA (adenosine(37)-N6)-threonylcarbamoyltransferase complex dimerization subunit type 1 TsaB [Candidatus Desantisbacteria bacterium]